jgi:glycerol-3-phosphate dehydrogenase
MLRDMGLSLRSGKAFVSSRPAITTPQPFAPYKEIQERIKLPEGDPERIVCRCEQVPERVITNALNRGIPVTSLDGVKRRTRAGMGPCQGQFCAPRVRRLVARENGISEEEVTDRGEGSGPLPDRVGSAELRKLKE